ncbi:MAG: hypothetical protein DI544_01890 [Sphingomonas taxi]|uniref:VanZ-like domain-containing protein n=1 Tax=Sphingomonas taxi TaxID=1549858 RepID=A0A2W5PB06_9SPHN|nr:MAG: hypothetical protein DI544_01890 [Sphingomonas taxi]
MELARAYKSLIDAIVLQAGSADMLHIHVGLALYLGTLVLARRPRAGFVALQVVLAAELANELLDWAAASPQWTLRDTLSDIFLTLMWPVAITAATQYRRRRWNRVERNPARSPAKRTVAAHERHAAISRPTTAPAPIASA